MFTKYHCGFEFIRIEFLLHLYLHFFVINARISIHSSFVLRHFCFDRYTLVPIALAGSEPQKPISSNSIPNCHARVEHLSASTPNVDGWSHNFIKETFVLYPTVKVSHIRFDIYLVRLLMAFPYCR